MSAQIKKTPGEPPIFREGEGGRSLYLNRYVTSQNMYQNATPKIRITEFSPKTYLVGLFGYNVHIFQDKRPYLEKWLVNRNVLRRWVSVVDVTRGKPRTFL